MVEITLQGVSKHFAGTPAVDNITLTVPEGALFFLLGPSGCGKTTLLRMLAGFVAPTAGRIFFAGKDITAVPANKRDTAMVFQSYALWPHMNVAANIAFGLKVRKVPAKEIKHRVAEALSLVRMEALANRKPAQLSGGQQQRVALARALAVRPRCLLLDEPLSNLDAQLRLEMRGEIRRIVKASGTTAVYVTHDQKEALAMADGIALLHAGRLEQTGTPREIYRRPATRFVAAFIGQSNFIHGRAKAMEMGLLAVETAAGIFHATQHGQNWKAGEEILLAIHPEAIRLADPAAADASRRARSGAAATAAGPNRFAAKVASTTYLGEMAEHVLQFPGGVTLKAFELNPHSAAVGPHCVAEISPEDVAVIPADEAGAQGTGKSESLNKK